MKKSQTRHADRRRRKRTRRWKVKLRRLPGNYGATGRLFRSDVRHLSLPNFVAQARAAEDGHRLMVAELKSLGLEVMQHNPTDASVFVLAGEGLQTDANFRTIEDHIIKVLNLKSMLKPKG